MNVNATEIFIPKENGNDKAEAPIKFHLQFLTVEEQSELEYFEWMNIETKGAARVKVKVNTVEFFKRGVTKIEGFPDADTADKWLAIRGPKWMKQMMIEVALRVKESMEIDEKN